MMAAREMVPVPTRLVSTSAARTRWGGRYGQLGSGGWSEVVGERATDKLKNRRAWVSNLVETVVIEDVDVAYFART